MDMNSLELLSETMASLHNIVEQLDASVITRESKNFEQQPFYSKRRRDGLFPKQPLHRVTRWKVFIPNIIV
jgi:hypothetical protein